jgi:Na+/glutamate symporter
MMITHTHTHSEPSPSEQSIRMQRSEELINSTAVLIIAVLVILVVTIAAVVAMALQQATLTFPHYLALIGIGVIVSILGGIARLDYIVQALVASRTRMDDLCEMLTAIYTENLDVMRRVEELVKDSKDAA